MMEENITLLFYWFLTTKDVISCYPDVKECCLTPILISKSIMINLLPV